MRIFGKPAATKVLQDTLKKGITPEVVGEIRLVNDEWKVEYESRVYEGLDPRKLMDLYAEWMKLLAQFVSNVDKTKLDQYIAELVEECSEYLFKWYTGHDFLGFEEFSFWLELLNQGEEVS